MTGILDLWVQRTQIKYDLQLWLGIEIGIVKGARDEDGHDEVATKTKGTTPNAFTSSSNLQLTIFHTSTLIG